MPEIRRANIEVAHRLNEDGKHTAHHSSRRLEILEIVEAIVLALVTVTTAWSGYQAALRQDEVYEQSTQLHVQAQGLQNSGGQERMYDASTVVEWMKAEAGGQRKLAELFERRFRPEFRVAFEAWKRTDPLKS